MAETAIAMVNESDGKAHLKLLIGLVRRDDLVANGMTDELIGILYEDLAALGRLLTPEVDHWWSTFPSVTRDVFIPALLKQYPQIGVIDLTGVTAGNFEEWLEMVSNLFGGVYLAVTPIKAA
jgi:hypothetical protein